MKSRHRVRTRQIEHQAEGYLELGMAQQALDGLKRLGGDESFSPHALYLKGEALRALERYDEAIPPLTKAGREDPEDVHILLALAWCQKRMRRLDLAIEAMEQAIKAHPGQALLHYNLACYLSLAGTKRRALLHLKRALDIDPDYRLLVDSETDFDPIRSDPDFQALTSIIV